MIPIHTFQPYFPKINFSIILPSTPKSSQWSVYIKLCNHNFVHISQVPVRSTCLAHLIHRDLILIVFDELYELCNSSSLFNLLQFPVALSLLDPNNLLSTIF
jgi:hypothetical protein